MINFLNTFNTFLYNFKIVNLKIFFANDIDIQMINYNILEKYTISKFNQYTAINAKDYSLSNLIQVIFKKFKTKYFDKFNNFI